MWARGARKLLVYALLSSLMGRRANDAPGHLHPAEFLARQAFASTHHLVGEVTVPREPPEVEGCGTPPPLYSLQAAWYRAPALALPLDRRQAPRGCRKCSIRGSDREWHVNMLLCLQVGPEGPHRHLRSTLLPSDLPPPPFLLVKIVHSRIVGIGGQADADAPRQGDHCLCLLGIGLEAHAVEERVEGVEGPLYDGGDANNNEPIFSVEVRQEPAHVRYFHDPVNFHHPDADNGTYLKVEDSWGEGATLGDAVLGFEDVSKVPACLTDELRPLPEQDDKPKSFGSHSRLATKDLLPAPDPWCRTPSANR